MNTGCDHSHSFTLCLKTPVLIIKCPYAFGQMEETNQASEHATSEPQILKLRDVFANH